LFEDQDRVAACRDVGDECLEAGGAAVAFGAVAALGGVVGAVAALGGVDRRPNVGVGDCCGDGSFSLVVLVFHVQSSLAGQDQSADQFAQRVEVPGGTALATSR